jgi:hypothetical protein
MRIVLCDGSLNSPVSGMFEKLLRIDLCKPFSGQFCF